MKYVSVRRLSVACLVAPSEAQRALLVYSQSLDVFSPTFLAKVTTKGVIDSHGTIMSLITPGSRASGSQKSGAHRQENNKLYALPLPLLFVEPAPTRIGSILGFLGLSLTRVDNPHCEGIFDPTTRSVWVSDHAHSSILWRRGFFGKGDLSRSEPSWLSRQINIRKSSGKRRSLVVSRLRLIS